MSIEQAPYYWLRCDHEDCTAKSTQGSEFTAWADINGAIEDAEAGDWLVTDDGKHYCEEHAVIYYEATQGRGIEWTPIATTADARRRMQ